MSDRPTFYDSIRTWTIEPRGRAWVLMCWGADISRGPLEVRTFPSIDACRAAAENDHGAALEWREAKGDERKHGVVSAADRPAK